MSDFKAEMHQIRFPPAWGSIQRFQRLAVFKGTTSKGRKEEREGREGKGKRGKGKKMGRTEGKGEAPQTCEAIASASPPLLRVAILRFS